MSISANLEGEVSLNITWSGEHDGFTGSGGLQVSFKRKERGTEETEEEGDEDGDENENENLAGTITSSEGGAKFTSANPGKFVIPFYSPLYSYGLINGTGSTPGILPPSTEGGNQPSLGTLFGQSPGVGQSEFPPIYDLFPDWQPWATGP